jgi:hemoglobin
VNRNHSDVTDLDSRDKIAALVDAFYARVLRDPRLAPIFVDVAEVNLQQHLPRIRSYWEKLLLGDKRYQGHTMDIHRALHARRRLQHEDFERWLTLFCDTVQSNYQGPMAQRAMRLATRIAANMEAALKPASNS